MCFQRRRTRVASSSIDDKHSSMENLRISRMRASESSHKYSMRINEDYLDNIEIADVSSEDVSVYQRDDYKNQFLFHTTEIIKGKPASFYINGIERLHRILVVALEHLPMVQDFDSHFNIVIGKNMNNELEFVYNAKGGFDICFP